MGLSACASSPTVLDSPSLLAEHQAKVSEDFRQSQLAQVRTAEARYVQSIERLSEAGFDVEKLTPDGLSFAPQSEGLAESDQALIQAFLTARAELLQIREDTGLTETGFADRSIPARLLLAYTIGY